MVATVDHDIYTVDDPRVPVGHATTPTRVAEPSAWQVDRELATDLPDQMRQVSGVSAAQATATLAAPSDVDAGWFSPWRRTTGTLLGQPLWVDVDVDGNHTRLFTGRTVDASADAGTDTVDVTALDPYADLGELATPAHVDVLSTNIKPGAHPLWVLEHALSSAGITPLPQTGPAPLIRASLMGSAAPTVGTLAAPTWGDATGSPVRFEEFADMPGQLAAVATAHGDTTRDWDDTSWQHITLVCERADDWTGHTTLGLVAGAPGHPAGGKVTVDLHFADAVAQPTSETARIRVEIVVDPDDSSSVVCGISTFHGGNVIGGATATYPVGHGPIWWAIDAHGDTDAVTVSAYQHGVLLRTDILAVSARTRTLPLTYMQLRQGGTLPVAGVQLLDWTPEKAGDLPGFQPDLYDHLDPLLGTVAGAPPGITSDAASTVRDLVAAEQGAFWFDGSGVPQFRNRHTLVGRGTDPDRDRVVTSRDRLAGFRWRESADQTASTVEVPVSVPRVVVPPAAEGSWMEVWSADRPILVPARTTITLDIELSDAAISPAPTLRHAADTEPGFGTQYEASPHRHGHGTSSVFRLNRDGGRRSYIQQIGPRLLRAVLINQFTGDRWLVDADGNPSFTVSARGTIGDGDPIIIRVDTGSKVGATMTLDANPWRQGTSAAGQLARHVADELSVPRPVLDHVEIVPDPRIGIGDIIRLEDPDTTGLSVRGLVQASRLSGTPDGMSHVIDVRPLRPTLADIDRVWESATLADIDREWAGQTLADLDRDPLRRTVNG